MNVKDGAEKNKIVKQLLLGKFNFKFLCIILLNIFFFSFVVNPLTPAQETLCQLQNDSSAHNPSAVPSRSASMYYMVKLNLRSENVCQRPWSFERVPNKIIRGLDNALIYTSTKEACLSACLNEKRFPCRSVEYDYNNMKCVLSDSDRRTTGQFVQLVDAQGLF